ncbi:MAG: hypothetical protein OJF49_001758 [Ktedonobacterales bacterium]|jgi:hypothetical protein|nr:MAG: hypothetical protein OJF49_001758 [Ktedonobacterales bacterium]
MLQRIRSLGKAGRGALVIALALLVALAFAVVFGSFGRTLLAGGGTAGPTTVHVVRHENIPQNHLPPLDMTIRDAAKVGKLATMIRALPRFVFTGPMSCPADFGVEYDMTFTDSHGDAVLSVQANPFGCSGLTINGGDQRRATDAFWAQMSDTISVPLSTLMAIPTGTSR